MTLRATEAQLTDKSWTVLGGSAGLHQVGGQPASADVTVSGPATGLLLALLTCTSGWAAPSSPP
jgi:hypothetical protein